jgi:hypothetical protein
MLKKIINYQIDLKKLFYSVFIFYCLCVVLILATSCNSIEKAKQTVKLDSKAFDEVGKLWQFGHPCANDTTVKFIQGETIERIDTFIQSKPFFDTTIQHDTITVRITVKTSRTDTVLHTVADKQLIGLLRDSINNQKETIARSDGHYQQLISSSKEALDAEKSESKSWMIRFGIAAFVISSFFLIKIYIFFNGGATSTILQKIKSKIFG